MIQALPHGGNGCAKRGRILEAHAVWDLERQVRIADDEFGKRAAVGGQVDVSGSDSGDTVAGLVAGNALAQCDDDSGEVIANQGALGAGGEVVVDALPDGEC